MLLQKQAKEKSKKNKCRLIPWKKVKENLPQKLKISLVTKMSHKSIKFRSILVLLFKLSMNGFEIPTVKEPKRNTTREEAAKKMEKVPQIIIASIAEAP